MEFEARGLNRLGSTPRDRDRFPSTRALWGFLILLTGLGAFLRFWRLGYQTYWTDESATIGRIRGTFDYMLSRLSDQGFPPGWYAMLRAWCIGIESYTGSGSIAFSTTVTRALPAILGTLTVPAMYFLARQFTDRRGALLVTLLTAVNPFLIYYSRDIKMYAAMWFFVVLNMAFFLKWQTTHKHLRWFPLFVLTGFLMTAMQSMAWFIVALQFIFLMTRPRLKSLDGPMWLVGTGVMGLLPVYWYTHRTGFIDRVIEQGNNGGLSWITRYTDMSWKTLISLPLAHLLGYLWPVFPGDGHIERANHFFYAMFHPWNAAYPATDDKMDWERVVDWFELGSVDFSKHLGTRTWQWMADAELYIGIGVLAILVLGLIPWRGIRRSGEREESVTRRRAWWVGAWIVIPTTVLALTWIPEASPWHRWVWGGAEPLRVWEPRYLGMIVPAWLLWLGASLRRLPTWPVRALAIIFVTAACTASALTNQLMLRSTPFARPAEIAMRFYDRDHPEALAIANPSCAYPQQVEFFTYVLAAGERPETDEKPPIPGEHWRGGLYSGVEYLTFLSEMRNNPAIETIVMTDRYGDLTDEKEPLSDAKIAVKLGAAWRLVDEETYEWHYEWRFYIFHTWRTRVWKRVIPAAPATTTASTRGKVS